MDLLKINRSDLEVLDDEVEIARYLPFKKLAIMLNQESIWFTNTNQFQDNHERKIPDEFNFVSVKAEVIVKKLSTHMNKQCKAYVSCWNKFESESAALWKIYDDKSDGVCIISTIGKLRKALSENILIGKVEYVGDQKILLPEIDIDGIASNYIGTEFLKIRPYKFEAEIRAVGFSKDDCKGFNNKVNLKEIINGIYISPFTADDNVCKAKDEILKVFDESIIRHSVLDESKKL